MKYKNSFKPPQNLLSQYLPYNHFEEEGVLMHKDGLLQATLHLQGRDFESSDNEVVNYISMQFNAILARFNDKGAIFFEAQKRSVNGYITGEFTNMASFLIDQERKNHFEEIEHFTIDYYITIVYNPHESGKQQSLISFITRNVKQGRDDYKYMEREIANFKMEVESLIQLLSGIMNVELLGNDRVFSYLYSCTSLENDPVKAPSKSWGAVSQLLTPYKLKVGDTLKLGKNFIPILSIMDFPEGTVPGILESLSNLNMEYRYVIRYIPLNREKAEQKMKSYADGYMAEAQRPFSSKGDNRIDNTAYLRSLDVERAIVEMNEGYIGMGHYSSMVMVWDPDQGAALSKINTVKAQVKARQFVATIEEENALEAFFSMIPGGVYANVKQLFVSSANTSHVVPLFSPYSGTKTSDYFSKLTGVDIPLLICSSYQSIPFYYNMVENGEDVGHLFVQGMSGSGKSTLLCLLASQFCKYPESQVFYIDKRRSSRQITLASEGIFLEPGSEKQIPFQALRHVDRDFSWCTNFIELLLTMQNIEITVELRTAINEGCKVLCDFEPDARTITTFIQMVQNKVIKEALGPYTLQGKYPFFDSEKEPEIEAAWITFEMDALMKLGEDAYIPGSEYIFYLLKKRFTGRPTLLIIDEGWYFLRHPFFQDKIEEWLRELRKEWVMVVFASQKVSEEKYEAITATILQECQTKIFLPNFKAASSSLKSKYEEFGLNERQIELIATARPKQDYYVTTPRGCRLFQLNMGEIALSLICHQNHKFLDELEEHVPQEEHLYEILKHHKLEELFEALTT